MKNQSFLSALVLIWATLSSPPVFAQCPSSVGLVGTPVVLNGNCYLQVQFAIPNSTVSIYNAGGLVAQGMANSSGDAVVSYPCTAGSLTAISSVLTSQIPQVCNESTITPPVILPVKLVYFTGELNQQKKVTLKWGTAYEFQNEKFEIEKSSDGINYEVAGTLASTENSYSEKNYQFDDVTFITGTSSFYRLKQTDIDGKISWSKVVYISDSRATAASVFPNPVHAGHSIMLKGIPASEMKYSNIFITNLAGATIPYKITGTSTIELPPSIVPGIYLVRINEKVLKLIKE